MQKRKRESVDPEEKARIRAQKNRESAQHSRDKQRQYITDLENTNQEMSNRVTVLEEQNKMLVQKLDSIMAMMAAGGGGNLNPSAPSSSAATVATTSVAKATTVAPSMIMPSPISSAASASHFSPLTTFDTTFIAPGPSSASSSNNHATTSSIDDLFDCPPSSSYGQQQADFSFLDQPVSTTSSATTSGAPFSEMMIPTKEQQQAFDSLFSFSDLASKTSPLFSIQLQQQQQLGFFNQPVSVPSQTWSAAAPTLVETSLFVSPPPVSSFMNPFPSSSSSSSSSMSPITPYSSNIFSKASIENKTDPAAITTTPQQLNSLTFLYMAASPQVAVSLPPLSLTVLGPLISLIQGSQHIIQSLSEEVWKPTESLMTSRIVKEEASLGDSLDKGQQSSGHQGSLNCSELSIEMEQESFKRRADVLFKRKFPACAVALTFTL